MNQKLEIRITRTQKKRVYKTPAIKGEIIINDFREWFYIPVKDWQLADYVKQWEEGLARISTENTSCLITGLLQSKRKYLQWWILYKIDNEIKIQNEVFSKSFFKETFKDVHITHSNCYDFIPKYSQFTESGYKVSEWKLILPADLLYETRFFKDGAPFLRKRKSQWAL